PSLATFSCPGTRNRIRAETLVSVIFSDLQGYAGNREAYGSSYEVFGFMSANHPSNWSEVASPVAVRRVPGIQKTENSVLSYAHKFDAFGLQGQAAGPSQIALMLDGDDSNRKNFPSVTGNHGSHGANLQFCDGSARFIPRSRFLITYEL